MRIVLLSATVMIALGAACVPVPVSDPPGSGNATQGGEQAETAIVASSFSVVQTLVAGFNDFSLDDNFFVYEPSDSNPVNRYVRRGVTLMGWSQSPDIGASWTYKGRISPPAGWSAIWGDPSLAIDPANRNVVYYMQLGITDASWDAVAGGIDITNKSPGADMADGFCLARSTDGGTSFPEVTCMKTGKGPATADRTALAVDVAGRVWVAQIVDPNSCATATVRVFHSTDTWSTFAEVATPPQPSCGEPILTRDSAGGIWYGAREGGSVSFQNWNDQLQQWTNDVDIAGQCGLALAERDVVIGGGYQLRVAHSYHFAVGKDESGNFTIRAVLQLRRDDGRIYLQTVQFTSAHTSCFVPPPLAGQQFSSWSTGDNAGEQFEPTINYQLRDNSPNWTQIFYTTENAPSDTDHYAHPRGVKVGFFGTTPLLLLTSELAPRDWYVCGRPNAGVNPNPHYWGDYISVTQIKDPQGSWWNVSAFSDSSAAPPCQTATVNLARPLHISATKW